MEDYKSNDERIDDCRLQMLAIQDAVEIFSGKWKIPIVGALIHLGQARFNELQIVVGKITSRMLSKELKELEINQIVERTVLDANPNSVQYSITPHGETCKEVIIALKQWGEHHRKHLFADHIAT